jgi:hypothetical protein
MKPAFAPRIAGTLLLALATSFAQNTSSGAIRWKYGAPNAVVDIRNAAKIEGLKTDDVHIYVALYDLKDTEYNRVWVQLVNHGKTPIEFNPQSVYLKDHVRLQPEAPDRAAEAIQMFGEAKSQELSSAQCTLMSAPHCQPTNTQVQMSKDVLVFSNARAEWIRDKSLKPVTVAPGEQVVGAILFRKGKKRTDYMLAIPVNGTTFEFPVSAENKPPSYD